VLKTGPIGNYFRTRIDGELVSRFSRVPYAKEPNEGVLMDLGHPIMSGWLRLDPDLKCTSMNLAPWIMILRLGLKENGIPDRPTDLRSTIQNSSAKRVCANKSESYAQGSTVHNSFSLI
jgi:hypothetical protein